MEAVKEKTIEVAKPKRVRKPMTKERRIALDIVQGLREIAAHKAGKIKLKTWEEVYQELQNEDKDRGNKAVLKRTKRATQKV